MSLVGPRPLSVPDAERLVRAHPPFAERFRVPPGITGLAQVTGARGAALTARLDLYYARHRSAAFDLALLMQTGWINLVGKKRGARAWHLPPEAPGADLADPARIARETARGLLELRRLVPIVLVCGPMLVAQARLSRPSAALALGLALCLAFVVIAPVSWRLLSPEGALGAGASIRVVLYAAIGAGVVLSIGVAVPKLFGIGVTFMTARVSLAICLTLFLVGGWGLGRDIGLEHRLLRERARADALAREAERAQLLALRAQLDPHFLFNTLNSIAEWCREDGAVAERAVLQLSAMLRSVLCGVKAQAWPLAQELELVENLLALHRLRDPELLELREDVDPAAREVLVPPLVLLPLAENAVKHGPCAGHRGTLELTVRREAEELVVRLENPGLYAGPRPGSSGLPDLERRLALAYAGAATLRIGARGERTSAELRVPLAGPSPGVLA